jgi:uncharacterized membrane-anchored protein YhcB (DUF1043 family)
MAMGLELLVGALGGLVVGGLMAWVMMRGKARELEIQLRSEQSLGQERVKLLQEAKQSFEESFQGLSAKALETNNQSFLTLAKTQFENFQQKSENVLNQKQDRIQELRSTNSRNRKISHSFGIDSGSANQRAPGNSPSPS